MLYIKNLLFTLLGCFILACGIHFFIIPCNLVAGGATGLGSLGNHMLGLDVATTVLLINISTMALGYFFLGRKYTIRTIISTFFYPLFLKVLAPLSTSSVILNYPIPATILGAVCVGLGVGIVFLSGASTGGTDPIPLILNRYAKMPIGFSMAATDSLIIILQALYLSPLALAYGILFVLVSSKAVDFVVNKGKETGLAVQAA